MRCNFHSYRTEGLGFLTGIGFLRSFLWILLLSKVSLISPAVFSDEAPASIFLYHLPDTGESSYQEGVSLLIRAWEAENNRFLRPGTRGKVGLKIYTHSGIGLRTPPELVRAVATFLEERGFSADDVVIYDLERHRLRESRFLPPISEQNNNRFERWPVVALNDRDLFLSAWYYESALPTEERRSDDSRWNMTFFEGESDRKSYLPAPLLFDVDFWINLPVVVQHPVIGISGTLANASLWNISNHSRFLRRPVSAATAAAEIAAIPELQRTWAFSILSMESFQIIGGPRFNAHYTHHRNELLLSSDPLALDRYALGIINTLRMNRGFNPVVPDPLFFRYGESLNLGDSRITPDRIRLPRNEDILLP